MLQLHWKGRLKIKVNYFDLSERQTEYIYNDTNIFILGKTKPNRLECWSEKLKKKEKITKFFSSPRIIGYT